MNEQYNHERLKQAVTQIVLGAVERVRADSQAKLKAILASELGADAADDLAHYFFGPNPNIKDLTVSVIRELGIVKNIAETTK